MARLQNGMQNADEMAKKMRKFESISKRVNQHMESKDRRMMH